MVSLYYVEGLTAGSCALQYELIAAQNQRRGSWVDTLFSALFFAVFIGIFLLIVLSFFRPVIDDVTPGTGDDGTDGPPPPYKKAPEESTRLSPARTPGFLAGLGIGALAYRLLGPRRPSDNLASRNRFDSYAHPSQYRYGSHDPLHSHIHDDQPRSSGSTTSAGYGGTTIH